MVELPTGRLTLLFTDIEGSTRLLQRLGDRDYGRLLGDHHRLLRAAINECEGIEVKTEGDSFFAVFAEPQKAATAAANAQRALAAQAWPHEVRVAVRMGVHTGQVDLSEREYVGLDVHRAARISGAGHGGEVLISEVTADEIRRGLPSGVRLRDLGLHRLKDLPEPERLFQLVIEGLPADFPPPRSLEMLASGLPQQLTAFFGREKELAETRELLAQSRLLTLTGAGGTGKSRLAIKLAMELLGEFPDGVFYVPLATLREPELVLPAIAKAFEVVEGENLRGRLVETIGSRQLLLLLDNFEQLLPAAAEIGQLLADTPRMKVLVTSRARLNLPGEREYVVPPLSVPDSARLPPLVQLNRNAAVALFVDRAQAVRSDFQLNDQNARSIAEICARVEGLPLAIELAAARVRLLAPQAIADRLSNSLSLLASTSVGVSERQRTLRGTIQWSYDLLDPDDRPLFRRLGVFRGGAHLTLVGRAMAIEDELELLERLGSLIDKSLIRRAVEQGGDDALRVEMLESIREFALERLSEEREAEEYRQRHAEVFLELAEEAEPKLTGEQGGRWLDRLEREHDNLRAAFTWAVEAERAEQAARLCAALWRFWQMRGHLSEGRERAEQAVRNANDLRDLALRSRAIAAAGSLAYWQADWPAARQHYGAALELERERGDRGGIADALYNACFPYWVTRDDVQAGMDLAQEALDIYRELEDRAGIAKTLWALGGIAGSFPEPRVEEALAYYHEAGEQFELLGNRPMLAWASFMSAAAYAAGQQLDEARAATQQALRVFIELGDVSGYALCLHGLAVLAWVEGRREPAVRLAAAADALARSTGVKLTETTTMRWLSWLGLESGVLGQSAIEADAELAPLWQQGSELSLEEAVAEAARL